MEQEHYFFKTIRADENDPSPLHEACIAGDLEMVKKQLKKNYCLKNTVDDRGRTPFYIACDMGHVEIVKFLLSCKKINTEKTDDYGFSPLASACIRNHVEVVELLLKDQHRKFTISDRYYEHVICAAVEHHNSEVLEILLKDKRIDFLKLWKKYTPDFYFLTEKYDEVVIVILIYLDGKVNGLEEFLSLLTTPIQQPFRQMLINILPRKKELILAWFRKKEWDSEIFAAVVLVSDNYLEFKNTETTKLGKKFQKFMKILLQLPQDLQMLFCKRIYLRSENFYDPLLVDSALKKVLKKF